MAATEPVVTATHPRRTGNALPAVDAAAHRRRPASGFALTGSGPSTGTGTDHLRAAGTAAGIIDCATGASARTGVGQVPRHGHGAAATDDDAAIEH